MIYPLSILMAVVSVGALINFSMFVITLRRRISIHLLSTSPRLEIARLTINRAMRLEFILFLCQLARCIHTYYELSQPESLFTSWPAIIERSFVTVMLVLVSVWDLIDRKRISKRLDVLYPEE